MIGYFAALILVALIFQVQSIGLFYIVLGSLTVLGFFYFLNRNTVNWQKLSEKAFNKKIFITALILRIVWVIFSYYFYKAQTGTPFEFSAADSQVYHAGAIEVADFIMQGQLRHWYMFYFGHFSDMGYILLLGIEYVFVFKSIFWARIIKCFYSAFMCILIYRIAKSNFGEKTGRIAAIIAMLMPNFIYYCGLHIKETEMVFFTVLFIYLIDNILKSQKYKFLTIFGALLLCVFLFSFRTVLGGAAVVALVTTLLFSTVKKLTWSKRVLIIVWVLLVGFYFVGGRAMLEIEEVWQAKSTNQDIGMQQRAARGNQFAKYGKVAVFAPMIFTIPFPTLVDIEGQENQKMLNGANYCKNILSGFIFLGLFLLIKQKKWREHLLVISFYLAYLGTIALSNFAHSERFHMPALPFFIIIASWGISQVNNKNKKLFNYWVILMVIAAVIWSYIKLAGRGIV